MDQFPPSPDPNRGPGDWETQGVRRIGLLTASGQNVELKWADGTSARIRVTAQGASAQNVNVTFTRLP